MSHKTVAHIFTCTMQLATLILSCGEFKGKKGGISVIVIGNGMPVGILQLIKPTNPQEIDSNHFP